ncbi:unnamed protein product [Urochloa humidicola]
MRGGRAGVVYARGRRHGLSGRDNGMIQLLTPIPDQRVRGDDKHAVKPNLVQLRPEQHLQSTLCPGVECEDHLLVI